MMGFLVLMVVVGLVWGGFALFRLWIEVRRQPGRPLQEVKKPALASTLYVLCGAVAAVSLMVLMSLDPLVLGGTWWLLLLIFALCIFEVACWSSELYQFSFHEGGLWYGRRWYSYQNLQSYDIGMKSLVLVIRGQRLKVELLEPLKVEVRLRLAVED